MKQQQETRELARQLLENELNERQFLQAVARQTMASLDAANLDLDRQNRVGYPEVVFAEGKTATALVEIVTRLQAERQSVLVTRVVAQQAEAVLQNCTGLSHHAVARTLRSNETVDTKGKVVVVTAGTGDLPVAEEACETLRWMGVGVDLICDVGVSGPHRLPAHLDRLNSGDAVVVVAGMEGALPSVVAGYVAAPVVAVPTSIGYGANMAGVAALLSMLNSCAANVAVVNIDAGFKGGYLAGLIARQTHA